MWPKTIQAAETAVDVLHLQNLYTVITFIWGGTVSSMFDVVFCSKMS